MSKLESATKEAWRECLDNKQRLNIDLITDLTPATGRYMDFGCFDMAIIMSECSQLSIHTFI